jgi:ABC-type uncharacterized transport system substrate-binding protein
LSKANGDHLLAAFEQGVENGLNSSFDYAGSGPSVPAGLGASDVFICTRFADGDFGKLRPKAGELKSLMPAPKVIAATGGVRSSKAVQSETRTIPIIFISGREKANDHDDNTENAAGVYLDTTKFAVENLPSHRQLRNVGIPRRKIFALINKGSKVNDDEKDWTNVITVRNSDLDAAFERVMQLGDAVGGLLISADPFFHDNKATIVRFANNVFKKPVAYPFAEYVIEGGLMSAGPDLADRYTAAGKSAAEIVNKKLSGTQLRKLRSRGKAKQSLTVNQATATAQLDKEKRDKLLGRADKVVRTRRRRKSR